MTYRYLHVPTSYLLEVTAKIARQDGTIPAGLYNSRNTTGVSFANTLIEGPKTILDSLMAIY